MPDLSLKHIQNQEQSMEKTLYAAKGSKRDLLSIGDSQSFGGKGLRKMMRTEKLSFCQPNQQSKLEMFQQEVEELFLFQTGVPSLLRHGGR